MTHQFLYMPNLPKPLLDRDLLEKLEAEIKFCRGRGVKVIIPETKFVEVADVFIENYGEIPKEVEDDVISILWASDFPGRCKRAEPVSITFKLGATPVWQKQYPLKLEGHRGLAPLYEQFLKFALLVEYESR